MSLHGWHTDRMIWILLVNSASIKERMYPLTQHSTLLTAIKIFNRKSRNKLVTIAQGMDEVGNNQKCIEKN